MIRTLRPSLQALVAFALLAPGTPALGASHRDAPLIAEDCAADNTDVYAFVTDGDTLTLMASWIPLEEPAGGPNFHRFSDNVRYSIHLARPDTGQTVRSYHFEFQTSPALRNDSVFTIGEVDDVSGIPVNDIQGAARNTLQTYDISVDDGSGPVSIVSGLPTAPPNVGPNVTPFYGVPATGPDPLTQQAIFDLTNGIKVFAGPRDDGFYADYGAFWDYLDVRMFDNDGDFGDGLGQDGGGPDTFAGFNVHTIAMQIPIADLPIFDYVEPVTGSDAAGLGIWASASRRRISIRAFQGRNLQLGPWIQVSRSANPLVNQVFIGLRDRDGYNGTQPQDDVANFGSYFLEPSIVRELGVLHPLFSGVPALNRTDLLELLAPDVLRVDLTTGPVPLPGDAGFDRHSYLSGDTTAGLPSGFPNGRRPGDDVSDILLSVITASTAPVGDNVAANDKVYLPSFPYLPGPHARFVGGSAPRSAERVKDPDARR